MFPHALLPILDYAVDAFVVSLGSSTFQKRFCPLFLLLLLLWSRSTNFVRATTRPLVSDFRNCRFFSELENFSRKKLFFGDFFYFLGRTVGCTMWGTSGLPQYPMFVVIGMRGGSWVEILSILFPNGDTTTCTVSYKTGRGRWQVGACQLIISRS